MQGQRDINPEQEKKRKTTILQRETAFIFGQLDRKLLMTQLFNVMFPTQIAAKLCRELELLEEVSQLMSLDISGNIKDSIRMTRQVVQDLAVRATEATEGREVVYKKYRFFQEENEELISLKEN